MAAGISGAEVRNMARSWSGFLPQNFSIMEEWELLEACEAQARLAERQSADALEPEPNAPQRDDSLPHRPPKPRG